MRVLVTGGTGFLGRALVDAFARRGDQTHATWHQRLPNPRPSVTWHGGDLRDPDATRQFVLRLEPELVVHTAYARSPDDLQRVTAQAAGVVAEAAAAVGARHLHLSTDVVFDGRKPGGYVEDDPVHPITAYGRAKADAERLVVAAHPDALLVRTSLLYGGAEPGPQERLVQRALDDDAARIEFFTDEIRNVTQVDDLASALVELASLDVSGPLHVAGSEPVSRHEFAWLLARAAGRADADRLRSASSEGLDPPRPQDCALVSAVAAELLSTCLRGAHEVLAV